MNDLEIVVTAKLGTIDIDFDGIKKSITDKVANYKGVIVTEDTIDRAKKDVAELNKDKKELNDRRIAVKKSYMKPCDDIDSMVKKLDAIYDEAVKEIKDQLEVFEVNRKAAKKLEVEKIYEESIGDMKDYLPLSKIYDSKWENIGPTPKAIRNEIENVVSGTAMAVETIKGMNSDNVDVALNGYKNDLSLANAIACINAYEKQKADIVKKEDEKRKLEDDRKAELEIERVKREERQRVSIENQIRSESAQTITTTVLPKVEPILAEDDFQEKPFISERPFVPGRVWAVYEIFCNPNDLKSIDAYLEMSSFEFRRG